MTGIKIATATTLATTGYFIATLTANPTQAFLGFLALILATHTAAWMISLSAHFRLARWTQRDPTTN